MAMEGPIQGPQPLAAGAEPAAVIPALPKCLDMPETVVPEQVHVQAAHLVSYAGSQQQGCLRASRVHALCLPREFLFVT